MEEATSETFQDEIETSSKVTISETSFVLQNFKLATEKCKFSRLMICSVNIQTLFPAICIQSLSMTNAC